MSEVQKMNERVFFDQLDNEVVLKGIPQRIVSLVPSQTELLYSLDLDDRVVGITKFCVHPNDWYKSKKRIGGTKTVDIEAVLALSPDLIIANKEENIKETIETLKKHCPVWVSDVKDLKSAIEMILCLGNLVDKQQEAQNICSTINTNFSQPNQYNGLKGRRVLYLVWRDPWMTIGGDTFINAILKSIGLVNVFENENRYPTINLESLESLGIDFVFLSSEPFPFKEKHISEIQEFLPKAKFFLVDGEMFSWYGSRLQLVHDYFKQLFFTEPYIYNLLPK